jgi:hypothetical protein
MCKILYHIIILVFLFYGCSTTVQPAYQTHEDCIVLIDTIVDGEHIHMIIYASQNTTDTYLHVFHDGMTDSLTLKNYYYDFDFHESLLFMNKQKQIINTWIAKTDNLIIFVLPYYPLIGLYAYRIEDNKINFIATSENLPIYSDYAFFARSGSDLITSCYHPTARNIYGGTVWKPIENRNRFEEVKTVAYNTYLMTDSTEFINILDNVYDRESTSTIVTNKQKQ